MSFEPLCLARYADAALSVRHVHLDSINTRQPQAEVELCIPEPWPLQGQVSLLAIQSPVLSTNLDPTLEQLRASSAHEKQQSKGLLGLLEAAENAVAAYQQL